MSDALHVALAAIQMARQGSGPDVAWRVVGELLAERPDASAEELFMIVSVMDYP